MISISKHAYFNASMISFCRIPNVLVFPCLRLLLQEVVHHDAAHAEILGIHYQLWMFQGLKENFCFWNYPNHVIPVANENHWSLIVPLESLLDQSFHIFEVLTCSITLLRMNKFWSLWHDYDYVWRDAYTRISSQSCELLIDNFHRKSLPTVLIGGPAEVVGSPMYVFSPVVPLRHLQQSIGCPVFINILVGALFLPGQPRSRQSRLRRSACSCRWTQRSWCSQSQESWRKVEVWAIEILY